MAYENVTQRIRSLVPNFGTAQPPVPAQPKGALPQATGSGKPTSGNSKSGGGITGPLTETAYAAREYHADRVLQTSDGLFSLVLKPIKTVKLTDGDGNALELKLKAPA